MALAPAAPLRGCVVLRPISQPAASEEAGSLPVPRQTRCLPPRGRAQAGERRFSCDRLRKGESSRRVRNGRGIAALIAENAISDRNEIRSGAGERPDLI